MLKIINTNTNFKINFESILFYFISCYRVVYKTGAEWLYKIKDNLLGKEDLQEPWLLTVHVGKRKKHSNFIHLLAFQPFQIKSNVHHHYNFIKTHHPAFT